MNDSDEIRAEGGEAEVTLPPRVSWLDDDTAELVQTIVATVARRHTDLRAAILFGSVARGAERLLEDAEPSDVDLLLVFDLEPEWDHQPLERRLAISHSIGLALDQHLHAPREVNVLTAVRDLTDWDPAFVANLATDGLLLWARDPLPAPLTGLRPLTDPAVKH